MRRILSFDTLTRKFHVKFSAGKTANDDRISHVLRLGFSDWGMEVKLSDLIENNGPRDQPTDGLEKS